MAVKVTVAAAGQALRHRDAWRKGPRDRSTTAKRRGSVTVKLSKVKKSLKGKKLTLKLSFRMRR